MRRLDHRLAMLLVEEGGGHHDIGGVAIDLHPVRLAERDPLVEPRSSGTIAVPIVVDERVLATVGMTYFKSAVSQHDIISRYAPLTSALGKNIAKSVSALR